MAGASHTTRVEILVTFDNTDTNIVCLEQHGKSPELDAESFLIVTCVRHSRPPISAHCQQATHSAPTSVQAADCDSPPDTTPSPDITTARFQDIHEEAQSHTQLLDASSIGHIHWPTLWLRMARGGNRGESVGGGGQVVEG